MSALLVGVLALGSWSVPALATTAHRFAEVQVARSFEKSETTAQLRARYAAAQKRSGLDSTSFIGEIVTLANVLDGRCPDGCCGNEDAPNWAHRLTPGEWTALAISTSTALEMKREAKKANKGRR
jgi:hypothetical protein